VDERHAHTETSSDGMLNASLVLGTLTFLSGAVLAYWAVTSMRNGSQSEVLMALWGVAPLMLATVVVFAVGSANDRSDAPRRRKSRLAGLLLAVAAFPFWLFFSSCVLSIMGWG